MRLIFRATLSIIVGVGLFSCSTNIPMNTSLNAEMIYNLEVNDAIPVTLTLENQLANGSFFQYEKSEGGLLFPVEDEMVYNEYVVLKQMFNDLIRYRFTNNSDSEAAQISVGLKHVTISSEMTENDKAITWNSLLFNPSTRLYTAEVQVEVTIIHEGQTHKRTIFGKGSIHGESFKNTKRDVGAFSAVLNIANNRVVHFTNQFLRDVGL